MYSEESVKCCFQPTSAEPEHSSSGPWPSSPPCGRSSGRSASLPGVEYTKFPLPRDYQEKTEWVFARLMYPPVGRYRGGFRAAADRWKEGGSNWTMDYPRSDRHLAAAVRRLTRIHARSVEQPVNLDEGDVYDWPWLYAVEVGHWDYRRAGQAMREYLLRGGFFMCDDFHGTNEWEVFTASMQQGVSRPPDRRDPEQRPDLPRHLRSGRPLPGARRPVLEDGHTYEKGGVRSRTGAASTTITAG